jgi:large subunit ribosomal protein L25
MTERAASEIVLTAWERPCSEQGKRRARRLRRQGFVPAVLYGRGIVGSLPIKVALKEIQHLATAHPLGIGTPVRLRVHRETGEVAEFEAVIQEIQRDPLALTWWHLDFFVPKQKAEASETVLATAASSEA